MAYLMLHDNVRSTIIIERVTSGRFYQDEGHPPPARQIPVTSSLFFFDVGFVEFKRLLVPLGIHRLTITSPRDDEPSPEVQGYFPDCASTQTETPGERYREQQDGTAWDSSIIECPG